MPKRVPISLDELLDAYPVARVKPSCIDHQTFVTSIRNRKPVILDGGAHHWLGLSEKCGPVTKILESLDECDVDILIALDGRNFLKHSLCATEVISLKCGMKAILSEEDESHSTFSDYPLCRLPGRRYIRTYFDLHSKLFGCIDLSYLAVLVSSAASADSGIELDPKLTECSKDSSGPFKLKNIGLWTSSKGCITPLHFDRCHGFLAQIVGRKTFLMASCSESALLRYWKDKNHDGNENGTTSSIDLGLWLEGDITERRKHPLVDEVAWFIASLYPGDILYTPPGWWHYVISETISVSVLIPFDPLPSFETLPTNVLTS
jgi:hypothetical protein